MNILYTWRHNAALGKKRNIWQLYVLGPFVNCTQTNKKIILVKWLDLDVKWITLNLLLHVYNIITDDSILVLHACLIPNPKCMHFLCVKLIWTNLIYTYINILSSKDKHELQLALKWPITKQALELTYPNNVISAKIVMVMSIFFIIK